MTIDHPVVLLVFLPAAALYAVLAFYPLEVGRWIATRFRSAGPPAVFWDLADVVARRRTAIRTALLTLVVLLAGVAVALLALARAEFAPGLSDAGLVVVVLGFLGLVVLLARLHALGLGQPAWPQVHESALLARARQAVEGPAIAAGLRAPEVQVAGFSRPTAFTLVRESRPVVVLTTGLLSLLTTAELKAVAAHEVGHIASDAVDDTQRVEFLFDLLRLTGTGALWLYVATVPSLLGPLMAALVGLCGLVALRLAIGDSAERVTVVPPRVVDGLILVVNPPLVVVNILAQALYAVMGQDEDLLADLRAVEFTRHPEVLHAALRRIRAAQTAGPPMPIAYHFRYFTAEQVLPEGFPSAQAPVPVRLVMLERIDPNLASSRPLRARTLLCPDCRGPLAAQEVASHYGAPIHVDACEACGGIWFDDLELYMTGAEDLRLVRGRGGSPGDGPLQCPRCRVQLERAATFGMPSDVSIWECRICKGAWVRAPDLTRFGEYRERRRGRRRTAAASAVDYPA